MTTPELTAELLAKIRIARSPNVGPMTYRRMMFRYGNAVRVVAHWNEFARKNQPLCDEAVVRKEIEKIYGAGGWLLVWGEADYPSQLHDLPDPPIVLSGFGDKKFLAARSVAIVGNRNASAAGLTWSRKMAEDLGHAGVVVVSGLARGIDTAAHEGALRSGAATIAVVAGGVDHIYPPENADLRSRIIAHGCVVSEQPYGVAPTASLFPRRNRIIAGLSIGTVVSEATRHSGSLITAECALNYGREVWAVPGNPADMRSGGPNWLLKNGATLIETAADILPHLPNRAAPYVQNAMGQKNLFDSDEPMETASSTMVEEDVENVNSNAVVYGLLGSAPTTFDELVRQSGLGESELNTVLTELELDGHAAREADGRWRRP